MKTTAALFFVALGLAPGCRTGPSEEERSQPVLATQSGENEITVRILAQGADSQGAFFVVGKARYETTAAMIEAIQRTRPDKQTTRIILAGEGRVLWQWVVEAYNAVIEAGFRQIRICPIEESDQAE